MKELLTFDDMLISPCFSHVKSRKDVDLSANEAGMPYLSLPLISANMDTVTGPEMAKAMAKAGGIGCLHRFMSIDDNVKALLDSWYGGGTGEYGLPPIVSIGLGDKELERAEALVTAGAFVLCLDVAHGAQIEVVKQYNKLVEKYGSNNLGIIVGNFATGISIKDFRSLALAEPAAFKIGIGPGSACTTRLKTGCGVPQLSAIADCADENPNSILIADGGMKTPGDIAKALGAGASYAMLGGMLAGTYETPGETVQQDGKPCSSVSFSTITKVYKKYRGSASKESYGEQGKDESWRTAEGESFMVPYKGPVEDVLKDIEGGLRSAFTYVGAANLQEFHQNVRFVKVSPSTIKENGAHGKQ